jgi:tripartite-type tricarboxylate transporter receptor subunit TctC
MVVPFQAGGTTDLLARLLAEGLGSRLGQPVVAENRGGAGGAVGAEIAARMEPDGHNLFFATIGSAAIIRRMQAGVFRRSRRPVWGARPAPDGSRGRPAASAGRYCCCCAAAAKAKLS